jgi:hypothetical protein
MASLQREPLIPGKQPHAAAWRTGFFGLPQLAFALPYFALLVWFRGVDAYHRHFSEPGLIVVAHNFFRVLYIFYLFWIVATLGLLLLRAVARQELAELDVLERLTAGFFAGAGVWHAGMLAFGFLDLYTAPIAIALTLPVVILSYVPARAAADDIYRKVTRADRLGGGALKWLLLAFAGIAFVTLLLVKGLYPGGGHDYFTHYFYYFQTVIKNGGLWPNDVWYQYYYSKGAGLFFLSILITDPLAPQLVTFCFMTMATIALFLILKRIASDTLWPLVGIILFLSIFISTPGSAVLYSANGGWGDFEKLHEINAALVVAVFWLMLETLSRINRRPILWSIATTSAIICAILINITIAVYFGALFALIAVFFAVSRQVAPFLVCIGLGAISAGVFIAVLILNQLTTGLADDQGILFFWNYANVEKLAQWGALPLVIMVHLGVQAMVAASAPLSIHTIIFLIESYRLDIIAPLILGGAIVSLPSLARGRWNRSLDMPTLVMASAILTFIAIALLFGRAQQVSFYRFASFTTGSAIVCGILAWNLCSTDSVMSRISKFPLTAIVVLLSCIYYGAYPQMTLDALKRGLSFASGRYSLDTAYTTQYGPPPRRAWSAIYTGARGAYSVLGPGTPIWSLHIHTYCMLPDCLVESYPSFVMTHHWDRVMFGTVDEAKHALQAAHLDYFLFTRDADIRDPLPLSPLFSPDNIGRSLGILWTDGTTSLLTWRRPGIAPLDQAWVTDYRRAVEQSSAVQSFPYVTLKQIFEHLDATPHPWHAFQLPRHGD